jgi:hypothetical protein
MGKLDVESARELRDAVANGRVTLELLGETLDHPVGVADPEWLRGTLNNLEFAVIKLIGIRPPRHEDFGPDDKLVDVWGRIWLARGQLETPNPDWPEWRSPILSLERVVELTRVSHRTLTEVHEELWNCANDVLWDYESRTAMVDDVIGGPLLGK